MQPAQDCGGGMGVGLVPQREGGKGLSTGNAASLPMETLWRLSAPALCCKYSSILSSKCSPSPLLTALSPLLFLHPRQGTVLRYNRRSSRMQGGGLAKGPLSCLCSWLTSQWSCFERIFKQGSRKQASDLKSLTSDYPKVFPKCT